MEEEIPQEAEIPQEEIPVQKPAKRERREPVSPMRRFKNETLPSREFRAQRINILDHTTIVFSVSTNFAASNVGHG